MVSANSEPTSEIVPAPFLPALLKFGHRCGGTGAVPGRQSHEKTVRRRARAAFFLVLRSATRRFKTGHSFKADFNGLGGLRTHIRIVSDVNPGTSKLRPQLSPLGWGRFFGASPRIVRVHPKGAIKQSGHIHRRQWTGRSWHERGMPAPGSRERHEGNNDDCEPTHLLKIGRNSCQE
jgi:hypothetical protein